MVAAQRWHAPYLNRLREPFIRSSLWWVVNTGLVAGSGLAFWFLAAQFFPVRQVGITTAAVSAVTLVGLIGKFGMDVSMLRFLPQHEGPRASAFVNTALTASAFSAGVTAVIYLLGIPIWSPHLGVLRHERLFIIGFILMCIAFALNAVQESIFSTKHRNDLVVYKNGLAFVGRVVALVIVGTTTLYVARAQIFVAWAVPFVAALAVSVWFFVPRAMPDLTGRIHIDRIVMKEMIGSTLANSLVSFVAPLPLSLGTLILLKAHGAGAAAVFYMLWMVGSLSQMGAVAFSRQSLVEMSRRHSTAAGHTAAPMVVSILIGLGVLVVGTVVLPLFGPEYAVAAGWPLVPFAIGAPIAFLHRLRLSQFRASGQHLAMVSAAGSTIVAFLGLLLWTKVPVSFVGWWWLAAMNAGVLVGYSIRAQARALLPEAAVREDVEA